MKLLRAGLFVLAAVLLVACQERDDALPELEGTRWVLVDVAGQPALPSPVATLAFTGPGLFGGHTSCNNFGGKFEVDGGRLRVTELMQNLAGCGPPIGGQESRYMEALSGARSVESEGDELRIYSDAFEQPLRFRPESD